MTMKNTVVLLLILLVSSLSFAQLKLKYHQPKDSIDDYYYRNLTPLASRRNIWSDKGGKI